MRLWRFISNFIKKIIYNYIGLIFKFKSIKNYLSCFFKKEIIVKNEKMYSNFFCIFVFYQNGVRDDTINILKELKENKISTILVSNKNLTETQKKQLELYSDVIITRPNFGRDFGAYKCGMNYINKYVDLSKINKLIFLNDSVFYSARGLNLFVVELLNEKYEVVGATQNLEIKRHIGSFCISVSGIIVRDHRFIKYWRKYRNSDVRPVVINRGEMKLSETIFKICGESSVNILYDTRIITFAWQSKKITYANIDGFLRSSFEPSSWKNLHFKENVNDFIGEKVITEEQIFNKNGAEFIDKNKLYIDLSKESKTSHDDLCVSNAGAMLLFKKYSIDKELIEDKFNTFTFQNLLDVSVSGSQIHQNNILFYFLGLPIIKNDCYFRGVFSLLDIEKMISFMPETERDDFRKIQMNKPYGKQFLKKDSLDYYAYMCGYL